MSIKNIFSKKKRKRKSSKSKVGSRKFKKKRTKVFFRKFVARFFRSKAFRWIITIFIIIAFGLALRYFLISEDFDIQTIEIKGNEQLKESLFKDELNDLIGENIFLKRSSVIAEQIKDISPFVKNISVEKKLPQTIRINLEERDPVFTWVNFSGVYLIDSEGIVLEVINDFDNLKIQEEDIDLLKGYANLEVVEREEKGEEETEKEEGVNLTEENENSSDADDKEKGEEDEIDYEEKIEIIEQNRLEVVSRVDLFWENKLQKIDEYYQKYRWVYSYEQKDYETLDTLKQSLLASTKKIVSIEFEEKEVDRYLWESSYRLVVELDGADIIFSTRRDIADQIKDLEVLMRKLKLKGKSFTHIDLSSEVIAYEVE